MFAGGPGTSSVQTCYGHVHTVIFYGCFSMNAAVKVVMGPATLLEGELEGLSLSERLPGEVVYTLLQFLDVQDLGRLAQTCTELRDIVYASDCWESLCVDRFGSILMLQSLVEEAGIPLPAARQPPSNWRNEYMRRLEQPPVDLDHIAAMYDDAQSRLQDNAVSTPEQFTEIAQILLSILGTSNAICARLLTTGRCRRFPRALPFVLHARPRVLCAERL